MDMVFLALKNHPEWQKECGFNLAPSDPFVLTLEKDKNRVLKRWCSACSIGQRCSKLYEHDQEDGIEIMISPEHRLGLQNQEHDGPLRIDRRNEGESSRQDNGLGAEGFSPIAGRTGGRNQIQRWGSRNFNTRN